MVEEMSAGDEVACRNLGRRAWQYHPRKRITGVGYYDSIEGIVAALKWVVANLVVDAILA